MKTQFLQFRRKERSVEIFYDALDQEEVMLLGMLLEQLGRRRHIVMPEMDKLMNKGDSDEYRHKVK